jgi:hypothetical protein
VVIVFIITIYRRTQMEREEFKPGEECPISGQWEIVGPRGGRTRDERTITKGEPFPPTLESGQKFVLVDRTKHKKKR